jgi:nucleoside-diphosphate-sugar epimerase
MSRTQQVQSKGIFHGLSVYPEDINGMTAIITGANGISGHYMLRVLAESPQRWKKIYCLSRRPPVIPGGLPTNAEHIPLDFLKSPEDIAATLKEKNVTADHVFFFSYVQPPPKPGKGLWSDADEMVRVNSELLSNFLQALQRASITPKRFMLQTGAKKYGGHLGPTKLPQEESDPRVELEPNFYYPQEDLLFEYSKSTGCGWSICMPGPITGAVPDAAMNYAYALAVYASVSKRLGTPLKFPGDEASWQMSQSMSYAMMNAYLEEWSVLQGPAGEMFNAFDGSAFTWEAAWPQVASWFGVESQRPQNGDEYAVMETRFVPRGYGKKGITRRSFSMTEWAKRSEVQAAWREMASDYDLSMPEEKELDRIFGFLDGTLCRPAPLFFSPDKGRKAGWHGYVDSCDALKETFVDLAKLKMVPPFRE